MCEIFGVCLHNSYCINDYLKEFYRHSDKHPHGWGLVNFEENAALIEKEPIQATRSNYLKERLSLPLYANTAFAHIRYATIGNVKYQNCHPYTLKDNNGRRWTFIHNGTIFDYPPLNKFVSNQLGDTDSERILMYLVEQVNELERQEQRRLTAEERFQLLDSIIVHMSEENKLNLLLYDGELVYVHTNYAASLYCLQKEEGAFFSTQPLSRENWHPVALTTLLAFQRGNLIYTGTNHKNEFFDNEENMKYLYQIFSDL